jgi:hypothetical protein
MNKRKITAGLLILVLMAAGGVALLSVGPRIKVVGTLAPADLAAIRSAIRRQIWSGTMPDFSWRSLKGFPGTVAAKCAVQIVSVEARSDGSVLVVCRDADRAVKHASTSYELKKGAISWRVTQTIYDGWYFGPR